MENLERENNDMIQHYKNLGYRKAFKFEDGILVDDFTGNGYQPKEIQIVEELRLMQNGKPSDNSILMIFETNDNRKGMFVIDINDSHNRELKDFFRDIPEDNYIQNDEARPSRPRQA